MNGTVFYPAGDAPALHHALVQLDALGCQIAYTPMPTVTHLLLPVPSFDDKGRLRGGGDLASILARLPENVTVVGGNLDHPLLKGYEKLDLLKNEGYLAQNAAITADCALQVARSHLPVVLAGCPCLILGWGRIGKCLASLLRACGGDVTVAARKETDLAMLRALGYRAVSFSALPPLDFRLIFNTVPHMVLDQSAEYNKDCVKIELASKPGIAGADVVQARGLPGKMAPQSSGMLIAQTLMELVGR